MKNVDNNVYSVDKLGIGLGCKKKSTVQVSHEQGTHGSKNRTLSGRSRVHACVEGRPCPCQCTARHPCSGEVGRDGTVVMSLAVAVDQLGCGSYA